MEPPVQYAKTSDGVSIAYAVLGQGPPLVCTPWSWQSIRFELDDTYGGPFYKALAQRYQVVLYDRRGVGLSDRQRTDLTLDVDVQDLETVVDHLRLRRFALMGNFHLGPAALAYVARHPQRVSRLILYGTYASGREITPDDRKTSITSMMRSFWGLASRTLADMTAPGAEEATRERIAHVYHESVSGGMAAELLELAYHTDVTGELARVNAPTLVLHRQDARAIPFRLGQQLASLLPNARLMPLEGVIHWPWFGDSGSVITAILNFLEEARRPARRQRIRVQEGLVTILFTDIASSTALAQRLGDAQSQEVRRLHNTIVRGNLQAHGGAEIKHTGDGIMASFGSAVGALECAMAIQRGIADHVAAHPDAPLAVYVGLNAGEPIAEERDLFGTSVDLARRLCDAAGPGEILVSNVVRELASGKGFLFGDRGAAPLKGFEDPVRLYELRWREP